MRKELYTNNKHGRLVVLIDEKNKAFDYFTAFGGVKYAKNRKEMTRKALIQKVADLKARGFEQKYVSGDLYYN